jgi:hypothetical protein
LIAVTPSWLFRLARSAKKWFNREKVVLNFFYNHCENNQKTIPNNAILKNLLISVKISTFDSLILWKSIKKNAKYVIQYVFQWQSGYFPRIGEPRQT